MTRPSPSLSLIISLLTFLAFPPHISAAVSVPPTLNHISNLTLPVPSPTNTNINPPRIAIQIDSTHNIYFTQYRRLTPERNYFAAIISFQTSLVAEYFLRRVETLETGGVSLDVYGATIGLDNPTGLLTYEMANRMLGELGEFLMEENVCTASFELWEIGGANVRQLSEGWLVPESSAKTAI